MLCSSFLQANPPSTFPYRGEDIKGHDVWRNGQTTFSGQIIIPACTLSMDNKYQVIDFGSLPVRDFQGREYGPDKKLLLLLKNCELRKNEHGINRVRLTFNGIRGSSPDKFGFEGQAKGIELQIISNHGFKAYPTKMMPPVLLEEDTIPIIYSVRLVRNGESLNPGDYYATLMFKVDYE